MPAPAWRAPVPCLTIPASRGRLPAFRRACRCNAEPCRSRRRRWPGSARRSIPPTRSCDTSSLINKPWNPITPRITCWMIVAEVVAGWAGSSALNTTCAVMAIGRSASGLKRGEIGPFQLAFGVSTTGSLKWVSAVARPWPGMCLRTGKMPPCSRPSVTARGDGRDLVRLGSIGAVADHGVGAGDRHVRQRQAIDGTPSSVRSSAISRALSRAALSPSAGSMS